MMSLVGWMLTATLLVCFMFKGIKASRRSPGSGSNHYFKFRHHHDPPQEDSSRFAFGQDHFIPDDDEDKIRERAELEEFMRARDVIKRSMMIIHYGAYLLEVEEKPQPKEATAGRTKREKVENIIKGWSIPEDLKPPTTPSQPTKAQVFTGMFTNYSLIWAIMSFKACELYYTKINWLISKKCRLSFERLVQFNNEYPVENLYVVNPLYYDGSNSELNSQNVVSALVDIAKRIDEFAKRPEISEAFIPLKFDGPEYYLHGFKQVPKLDEPYDHGKIYNPLFDETIYGMRLYKTIWKNMLNYVADPDDLAECSSSTEPEISDVENESDDESDPDSEWPIYVIMMERFFLGDAGLASTEGSTTDTTSTNPSSTDNDSLGCDTHARKHSTSHLTRLHNYFNDSLDVPLVVHSVRELIPDYNETLSMWMEALKIEISMINGSPVALEVLFLLEVMENLKEKAMSEKGKLNRGAVRNRNSFFKLVPSVDESSQAPFIVMAV